MSDLTEDRPATGRIFLTLQRGGRLHCIALSPAFFFALVALAGLLLAASLAQTALLLLRDPPTPTLASAEPSGSALRISRLQGEVERLTSRDLVTSGMLEKRVRELAERQAELEAQALTLERFGDKAASANTAPADDPADPPSVRLKKLDGAMNELGKRNAGALAALTARRRMEVAQVENALKAAGLPADAVLSELARSSAAFGAGGPAIALDERIGAGPFASTLRFAEPALSRHALLMSALASIPLRSPLPGSYETSSNFGPRLDPFTRRTAWHSGVDLHAEGASTDVRATAGGVVVSAGWNGAYGLMVEIDHGAGLTTRYGHLSKTLVAAGQTVAPGATLGRTGSTGRSTGPHLHYEVRVRGEAVDPARVLSAGKMIASLLDTRSRARDLAYLDGK